MEFAKRAFQTKISPDYHDLNDTHSWTSSNLKCYQHNLILGSQSSESSLGGEDHHALLPDLKTHNVSANTSRFKKFYTRIGKHLKTLAGYESAADNLGNISDGCSINKSETCRSSNLVKDHSARKLMPNLERMYKRYKGRSDSHVATSSTIQPYEKSKWNLFEKTASFSIRIESDESQRETRLQQRVSIRESRLRHNFPFAQLPTDESERFSQRPNSSDNNASVVSPIVSYETNPESSYRSSILDSAQFQAGAITPDLFLSTVDVPRALGRANTETALQANKEKYNEIRRANSQMFNRSLRRSIRSIQKRRLEILIAPSPMLEMGVKYSRSLRNMVRTFQNINSKKTPQKDDRAEHISQLLGFSCQTSEL